VTQPLFDDTARQALYPQRCSLTRTIDQQKSESATPVGRDAHRSQNNAARRRGRSW
jgi:hypothetical protein